MTTICHCEILINLALKLYTVFYCRLYFRRQGALKIWGSAFPKFKPP